MISHKKRPARLPPWQPDTISVQTDALLRKRRNGPGPTLLTTLVVGMLLLPERTASYLRASGIVHGGALPASTPWHYVLAVVMSTIVTLSLAALVTLLTMLAIRHRSSAVQRLLNFVGGYVAIGAVVGTLRGLRIGLELFASSAHSHERYGPPDLLHTISDEVALMTLIMLALCSPRTGAVILIELRALSKVRRDPDLGGDTFGGCRYEPKFDLASLNLSCPEPGAKAGAAVPREVRASGPRQAPPRRAADLRRFGAGWWAARPSRNVRRPKSNWSSVDMRASNGARSTWCGNSPGGRAAK
jgi:hypothetical protein